MARERKRVTVRVEEESETTVLRSDVLDVMSVRQNLEDAIPVMEAIDPILASEEGVDDSEEQLRGVKCRIRLTSSNCKRPSAVQITGAEELIGGVEPPFGFGSAATIVHFHGGFGLRLTLQVLS